MDLERIMVKGGKMQEEKVMEIKENWEIKLPEELLDKMDLHPSDKVCFQLEGLEKPDTLILKKAQEN